jgi:hypothetical protein
MARIFTANAWKIADALLWHSIQAFPAVPVTVARGSAGGYCHGTYRASRLTYPANMMGWF